MARKSQALQKPLLTITEVAVLLERDRSVLYDAINEGRFPLPIVRLRKQMLIPRAAVDRMLSGEECANGDYIVCSECAHRIVS